MKLSECKPGDSVVIGGRYLMTELHCTAVIIRVVPPTDNGFDTAYPHGMVQVQLPEHCTWAYPRPFIGPEDLAPPFPSEASSE